MVYVGETVAQHNSMVWLRHTWKIKVWLAICFCESELVITRLSLSNAARGRGQEVSASEQESKAH